jgi:hypothetical protein
MVATRSLLWLVGTLAVVAVLWMTLLSGGGGTSTTPAGAPVSSGTSGTPSAGDYNSAIGAARGAVQQSAQDAKSAAGSSAGTP